MINLTRLVGGRETVSTTIRKSAEVGRWVESAPVTVWNITNVCNLRCRHCYASSLPSEPEDELTTEEALGLIDDMASMGVPLLIFSGGEPLMREDIFELCRYATRAGIKTIFSTNGVFIDDDAAEELKRSGARYVGVSVDGLKERHEEMRGMPGCFEKSLEALEILREKGLRTGIRFTVTKQNVQDLEAMFDILEEMKIPRICVYHLVYSGRGEGMRSEDLNLSERRRLLDFLIERALELRDERDAEVETVNSPVDGVYTYLKLRELDGDSADRALQVLRRYGGDPTGSKVANVDQLGRVHPNQFWWDHTLGVVKRARFSDIWLRSRDSLLIKLRSKSRFVKGRCGRCVHREICAGYRLRALRVYGDVWAEDPGCYLSEEETLEAKW